MLPDRRGLDRAAGWAGYAPELHLNKHTSSQRVTYSGGDSKRKLKAGCESPRPPDSRQSDNGPRAAAVSHPPIEPRIQGGGVLTIIITDDTLIRHCEGSPLELVSGNAVRL